MVSNRKRLMRDRQLYTAESWEQLHLAAASNAGLLQLPWVTGFQAQFEADVLTRLGYGIEPRDEKNSESHPFGIRAVTVRSNLEVKLPSARNEFAEVIGRLTPVYVSRGEYVDGVSGLRCLFKPGGTTVYNSLTGASVVLAKVDRNMWSRGLSDYYGENEAKELRFLHEQVDGPVREEREFHRCYRQNRAFSLDYGVGEVFLSALLRRPQIFGSRSRLEFVDLWRKWIGDDCLLINIEWAGELEHGDVVERFLHPVFGLPFALTRFGDCLCDSCLCNGYSIDMIDTVYGQVQLALRRSRLFDADRRLPKVCAGDEAMSEDRRRRWSEARRRPSGFLDV